MLSARISAGCSTSSPILTRSSSSSIVPLQGRTTYTCSGKGKIIPLSAAERASVACSAATNATDVQAAADSRRQQATPSAQRQQQTSSRTTASRQQAAAVPKKKTVKPKPHLVRVAGRTSSIQQAAGAVVKRLETEDMVRVAAIDSDSLPKAMLVLTAANNMSQGNSGRMLVFQPTLIGKTAAEPPSIPAGSMVMYCSQIMAGEVLALNMLRATPTTDYKKLSRAIIARVGASSHTLIECYGSQALAVAVQAVAQARKGLLVRGQDAACVLASTKRAITNAQGDGAEAESPAAPAAAAGDSSSKHPSMYHRLIVLECELRRPRALLVRSTVGVSDRAAAARQPSQAPSSVNL